MFCPWAVAFHTALALKEGLEPGGRGGHPRRPLARLTSSSVRFSTLARTLIEKRGRIADKEREAFLAAGFGKDHLLEVIAAVVVSPTANYNPCYKPTVGSAVSGACLERLSEAARHSSGEEPVRKVAVPVPG